MFLHDIEFVCRTGWGGGVADLIPDPVTPNNFLTLVVMFSLQPFRRCQKKLTDRRFESEALNLHCARLSKCAMPCTPRRQGERNYKYYLVDNCVFVHFNQLYR